MKGAQKKRSKRYFLGDQGSSKVRTPCGHWAGAKFVDKRRPSLNKCVWCSELFRYAPAQGDEKKY